MTLAEYLKANGLSQEKFARKVGRSPSMVGQWVQGVRPISPKMAIVIERVTDGEINKSDIHPELWPKEDSAA